MTSEATRHLCANCIGDRYLKEEIQRECVVARCAACGETRAAMALQTLGSRLDTILRENFRQVDSDDRFESGDSLNWIVQEILEVEPDVASLVLGSVPEEDDYHIVKDGGTPFYDSAADYVELPVYEGEFRYTWESFRHSIKHTARFFSAVAESSLTEILSGLERFEHSDGRFAIRELRPDGLQAAFYRARIATSYRDALTFWLTPHRELGPPPSTKAPSGRMNAAGVAVFYGALDANTCVQEVRPPVGSLVVVAKFALLRTIRVLDLTVLDDAFVRTSYFDPEFQRLTEQRTFLHTFHAEISRPVQPHEEVLEFIPTQAVAEFLAQRYKPPLDGVLYSSTQTGGKGINIVLLHHAALIEGSGESGKVEGSLVVGDVEGDVSDGTLFISKVRPPRGAPVRGGRFDVLLPGEEPALDRPSVDERREATLRLGSPAPTIYEVVSVKHDVTEVPVVDGRKAQTRPVL